MLNCIFQNIISMQCMQTIALLTLTLGLYNTQLLIQLITTTETYQRRVKLLMHEINVICMSDQGGVKVFRYVRVVLGFLGLCVQHVRGGRRTACRG